MTSDLFIHDVRVMDPVDGAVGSSLLVHDGKIAEVKPTTRDVTNAIIIDGHGCLLTPGLIDVHTHGIEHHLYESEPDALISGVGALAKYGVTTALPTIYKVLDGDCLDRLEALADAVDRCRDACVPGLHLEGPFLAIPGAGALTMDGDVALLGEILAASNGRIAAMSISPETPNILPVIERLVAEGVVVFITHTCATAEQTQAAIDAGARHATHFYDVFPVPEETEPGARPVGAVEAILADNRVSVDFIADGVHVHPTAIRAAIAAKGHSGVLLVTDSNMGAGLPDGVYESPWGYTIQVTSHNATRIHDQNHPDDGLLAGSSLTMNTGMQNLLRWVELPAHQVWSMGTHNPAKLLGLADKGRICVGADADLVLWDDSEDLLRATSVWISGECVFNRVGAGVGNET